MNGMDLGHIIVPWAGSCLIAWYMTLESDIWGYVCLEELPGQNDSTNQYIFPDMRWAWA